MDVCYVLFIVWFYSSFVCISAYANVYFKTTTVKQKIKMIVLRECLRARRFRATLLLHTTCVRSYCTWRAGCVAAYQKKKKGPIKGLKKRKEGLGFYVNWHHLLTTLVHFTEDTTSPPEHIHLNPHPTYIHI